MTAVLDYLDDILDGVEKIKRYTREMTYKPFVDDPKTGAMVTAAFCHLPPRSWGKCQHSFLLS